MNRREEIQEEKTIQRIIMDMSLIGFFYQYKSWNVDEYIMMTCFIVLFRGILAIFQVKKII